MSGNGIEWRELTPVGQNFFLRRDIAPGQRQAMLHREVDSLGTPFRPPPIRAGRKRYVRGGCVFRSEAVPVT
jgi:hypothetical protein